MTWSLGIEHGDLALGNASIRPVTGATKLMQDLRAHLLEHMGTDSMHPEFGSLLDGGVDANGVEHPGFIGDRALSITLMKIESEIGRVIRDHQQKQLARAKDDKFRYGKVTLTPSEVLLDAGVAVRQTGDNIDVTITVVTGDGAQDQISFPLQLT